jgi:hypothetical protein
MDFNFRTAGFLTSALHGFILAKHNPAYLSILSTQPNLISDSFLAKNTLDMFPHTHIEGLGRVDRFTFIL